MTLIELNENAGTALKRWFDIFDAYREMAAERRHDEKAAGNPHIRHTYEILIGETWYPVDNADLLPWTHTNLARITSNGNVMFVDARHIIASRES
jgi:hypothetical protein